MTQKLKQYDGKRKSKRLQKVKETQSKKKVSETAHAKNVNANIFLTKIIDKTLDDSIWKDSFDRLLDTRSPLRRNNIIRKNVRLSYNLDSSVNTSNEQTKHHTTQKSKHMKGHRNTEPNLSKSILIETPIFKRKSFLKRFDEINNKNAKRYMSKHAQKAKESTISSTPLAAREHRKTKKLKSKTIANECLFLPAISPIRIEASPKVNESLYKTITESEKKRLWKNGFGMNSSIFEKRRTNNRSKAKRAILASVLNADDDVQNKIDENFGLEEDIASLENGTNSKVINSAKELRYSKFSLKCNLLASERRVQENNCDTSTDSKLQYQSRKNSFDFFLNSSKKNEQEYFEFLTENGTNSLIEVVESDLDKSLLDIGESIHQISEAYDDNCNGKNMNSESNIELLEKNLQILEKTYTSILESGEKVTPEINNRLNSIEKNLDSLILHNSAVDQLSEFDTLITNGQNAENTLSRNSVHNVSAILKNQHDESVMQLTKDIENNLFENNPFIWKLKFLQNCLAFSGRHRRRSLPTPKVKNYVRNTSSVRNKRQTLDAAILSSNINFGKQTDSVFSISNQNIIEQVSPNSINIDKSGHNNSSHSNPSVIRPLRKSLLKNLSVSTISSFNTSEAPIQIDVTDHNTEVLKDLNKSTIKSNEKSIKALIAKSEISKTQENRTLVPRTKKLCKKANTTSKTKKRNRIRSLPFFSRTRELVESQKIGFKPLRKSLNPENNDTSTKNCEKSFVCDKKVRHEEMSTAEEKTVFNNVDRLSNETPEFLMNVDKIGETIRVKQKILRKRKTAKHINNTIIVLDSTIENVPEVQLKQNKTKKGNKKRNEVRLSKNLCPDEGISPVKVGTLFQSLEVKTSNNELKLEQHKNNLLQINKRRGSRRKTSKKTSDISTENELETQNVAENQTLSQNTIEKMKKSDLATDHFGKCSNITTRRSKRERSLKLSIDKRTNSIHSLRSSSINLRQPNSAKKGTDSNLVNNISKNSNNLVLDRRNKSVKAYSKKVSNETLIDLSREVLSYDKQGDRSDKVHIQLSKSKISASSEQKQDKNEIKGKSKVVLPENKIRFGIRKCKIPVKRNKSIEILLKSQKRRNSRNSITEENCVEKLFSLKNNPKKTKVQELQAIVNKENSIELDTKIENYNNSRSKLPEIQVNGSASINDRELNAQIEPNETLDSIVEISFDRDELIRNIEKNHLKKKLIQPTTLKYPSLSRRGTLTDLTNITKRKTSLMRKSTRSNISLLPPIISNITLRNSDVIKNSSTQNSRSMNKSTYDTLHEYPNIEDETVRQQNGSHICRQSNNRISFVLSGGKWRRSLNIIKRNSMIMSDLANSNQRVSNSFFLIPNSVGKRNNTVEILNRENLKNAPNVSTRNSNTTKSINKSGRSLRNSNRTLSLVKSSRNKSEVSLNGSDLGSSYIRKTLLLEPTDDEAPIIHTSCSLFNTFEKQSKSFSSSSIGAAETAASCIQEKQLLPLQNHHQSAQQQQQQEKLQFIEKSFQQQQLQSGKSSSSALHQYPEIVEEIEEEEELQADDDSEYNLSDGDVEYFNDRCKTFANNNNKSSNCIAKQNSDENHKSLYAERGTAQTTTRRHQQRSSYQHQFSVPVCGSNRQSVSVLGQPSNRRRRTSFIEGFADFCYHQEQRFLVDNFVKQCRTSAGANQSSTTEGRNRLQKSICNKTTLLSESFENNEKLICCPTLDVSLRAQLSPREIVLRRCQQTDPFEFSTIYAETSLRHCRKIGEGVYGEVFMNKNENGEAIVLKIIPIEGQIEVNGEVQKNFEQILPEIIIAEELSRLRNDKQSMTSGFVEVKNVHCVQGCYPDHLIDLWELYRDNCGTENDHPEIFPEDQLYIIFELANAGQDLEAFHFQNALQSYSAFLQVALSLAVAEEKFKFEHRDLHWGNILLSPTDQKQLYFKSNGRDIKIPTHGVKATIIDYTLSRIIFEGCCLYNDLSNDNELFSASGDYQFDVYRLMQKRLDNQWEKYEPYTNILWLHYTIDKMISGARYRCSKTKKHRSAINTMMKLRDELLDYNSASDYVESFDE